MALSYGLGFLSLSEVPALGFAQISLPYCGACVYLSANRFPTRRENEIQTFSFVFCLPAPSEKGIRNSNFLNWQIFCFKT